MLVDWLEKACAALGLKIEVGFVLRLGGQEIRTIARIHKLGAPHGMLVISDFSEVRTHLGPLAEAGFGYSVLEEPRSTEAFDLESFRELFADWGWSGSASSRPPWIRVGDDGSDRESLS